MESQPVASKKLGALSFLTNPTTLALIVLAILALVFAVLYFTSGNKGIDTSELLTRGTIVTSGIDKGTDVVPFDGADKLVSVESAATHVREASGASVAISEGNTTYDDGSISQVKITITLKADVSRDHVTIALLDADGDVMAGSDSAEDSDTNTYEYVFTQPSDDTDATIDSFTPSKILVIKH